MTTIGKGLETKIMKNLIFLHREFFDVFAWSLKDVPGIPKSVFIFVSVHRLSLYKEQKLVRQKKRNHAPERQKVIDEEVEKLLKAKFIYEIEYPEWLANVVLAKYKANGKM